MLSTEADVVLSDGRVIRVTGLLAVKYRTDPDGVRKFVEKDFAACEARGLVMEPRETARPPLTRRQLDNQLQLLGFRLPASKAIADDVAYMWCAGYSYQQMVALLESGKDGT